MWMTPKPVKEALRIRVESPWILWLAPPAFLALLRALHLALTTVVQSGHFLPLNAAVLVAMCTAAAGVTLPLYRAPRLIAPVLWLFLLFAAFVLHYVVLYAFHTAGYGWTMCVAVINSAVATGCLYPPADPADLRLFVWDVYSNTLPLVIVPQVLVLLLLSP